MVNQCSVPKCRGTNGFCFPKDPVLRRKWIQAVNKKTKDGQQWEPTNYSCVCKLHFKPEDFKEKNAAGFDFRTARLKEGVVPTIFDIERQNAAAPPPPKRKAKAARFLPGDPFTIPSMPDSDMMDLSQLSVSMPERTYERNCENVQSSSMYPKIILEEIEFDHHDPRALPSPIATRPAAATLIKQRPTSLSPGALRPTFVSKPTTIGPIILKPRGQSLALKPNARPTRPTLIPKDPPQILNSIRARNYTQNLLRRLWNNEASKDLTIVSRYGVKTKCHRAIFAIISPYVSEILKLSESSSVDEELTLHIPDFSHSSMRYILRKLYQVVPLVGHEDLSVLAEVEDLAKVLKLETFEQNFGRIESSFSLRETGLDQMSDSDFVDNFDSHVKAIKFEPIDLEEMDPLSIIDPIEPEPITLKIPIVEVLSRPKRAASTTQLLKPSIKKLTVNCIDCNDKIETTYQAYENLVKKLKLPISRFRIDSWQSKLSPSTKMN